MALQADLLRLTIEQASEHVLILLDAEGTVVGWLMGAERFFGYTAAEMVGGTIDRLFTPEDLRLGIPAAELETARKHGVGEDDRWLVRKDGARIFVSGVATRLCDASGKVVGFCKLLRERTDIKLQIDKLRHQVGALETEDRRKTLVLDTLAHELRSPLGVLANAAQLIEIAAPQEGTLADPTRIIRRQVNYLQSLVEDLLEAGRMREAKVAFHPQRVDLQKVIADALESCGAQLRERGHRVETLVPAIPLDADETRLRQVFVNLVSNAVQYSAAGTTIWIKATTEGDQAVARVEDEGSGIPADLLPHVFDLFTQGRAPVDQRPAGLGLGLSLVKQYVELHGGTVQVRSDGQGRGTEFIVRLPLPRQG